MKQQANNAAIYCRLSRDDDYEGDSTSIQTQKQMLTEYANRYNFNIISVYVDDGYSGTNYDRPDFRRMEADIEAGKIDIVLTKDLSRLGREYLQTGYYTEIFFAKHNVRYIAVNDNVDTANTGSSEFTPFFNIMNEFYAKDISKKTRSGYRQKALNGDFTASMAPYGYKKSEHDKHKLVIDEAVADNVRRIFQMAVEGYSTYKIANILKSEKILMPRAYFVQVLGKAHKLYNPNHPYDWCSDSLRTLIRNRVYLGHMVSHKRTTKSFKVRDMVAVPPEEHIVVLNTHEPLIDEDTFEIAQRVIKVKKRCLNTGEQQIFQGLLKCSCGRSLTYTEVKGGTYYNCNLFRSKGSEYCTPHRIRFDVLYSILLEDIQRHAKLAGKSEKEFVDKLTALDKSKRNKQLTADYKERDKLQRRSNELQSILKKLYEDKALGEIDDVQYNELKADFEKEKAQAVKRVSELEVELTKSEEKQSQTSKFYEIVREFTDIKQLTKPVLNELIDKVIVHEKELVDGKQIQQVDIYYRFVGKIDGAEAA